MKLINPNEIKFVLVPIAPVLSGESVHYERVAFQQEVDQMRRIEAEPVRHGTWLPDRTMGVYWVCSNCGFPSEASGAFKLYKYCPSCGAKMDGEEKNESV